MRVERETQRKKQGQRQRQTRRDPLTISPPHLQHQNPTALAKEGVQVLNKVSPKIKTFLGDSVRLSQIIQNLVNNALKFTFVGSITISARRESKGKMINIGVTDTGIGIPKEKQGLVFERLRQVDEAADRKFGGTG